jgi:hypothetical protein
MESERWKQQLGIELWYPPETEMRCRGLCRREVAIQCEGTKFWFCKAILPRTVQDTDDAMARRESNCEYNNLANLLGRCCGQQHLPMADMGGREFLLMSIWYCSTGSAELTADTII